MTPAIIWIPNRPRLRNSHHSDSHITSLAVAALAADKSARVQPSGPQAGRRATGAGQVRAVSNKTARSRFCSRARQPADWIPGRSGAAPQSCRPEWSGTTSGERRERNSSALMCFQRISSSTCNSRAPLDSNRNRLNLSHPLRPAQSAGRRRSVDLGGLRDPHPIATRLAKIT